MTAYERDNLTLNPWDLASSITNKGFTGHEQLDGVGLIHMNGRVYDAEIGRFLSADPFIQDRTNLQALNRYTYVLNNPLSYTDPSGYFFKKLFKKIGKIFKKAWKGIKKVAKGIFKGIKRQLQAVGKVLNAVPGLSTVVGIAIAIVASPAAAEIYFQALAYLNTAISLANGAPIGDVLTGFAVGMVVGGISGGLGDALAQTSLGVAGHYVASGLAGGAAAKALGGRFKDGFAGGLLSAGARHAMGHFDQKLEADSGPHSKNDPTDIRNGVKDTGLSLRDENGVLTGDIVLKCQYGAADCGQALTEMASVVNAHEKININFSLAGEGQAYDLGLKVGDSRILGLDGDYGNYARVGVISRFFSNKPVITLNTTRLDTTAAHEFGHAMGLGYQANYTRRLMSYSHRDGVPRTRQFSGQAVGWLLDHYGD
ncbi:RHS repeat-associated core domain-containing protein [Microbulbifer sp. 2304DJ12-6]|uniref:RHS repeat-associated core domain-containing protein n=1 Tax=Microbulbifer sp. 2304DJ12-6 TaxID=3233340 RepID=UPI0039AEB0E3